MKTLASHPGLLQVTNFSGFSLTLVNLKNGVAISPQAPDLLYRVCALASNVNGCD